MKKILAGIIAMICVFGTLSFSSPSNTIIRFDTVTAATSDEVPTPGLNSASYKYEFADTDIYSTQFTKISMSKTDENNKKVDISTWKDNDGNTFGIYSVTVTETATKGVVNTEYVIGLVTAKETLLDVSLVSEVEIPDDVREYLDDKSISLANEHVSLLCDSCFAGSYLKTIDLTGIKYIGNKVFNKCAFITDIVIPDSVLYVGTNTFDSSGLKTLSVQCELPVIPAGMCTNTKLTKIEFKYPQYIKKVGNASFKGAPIAAPFFMSDYYKGTSGYELLSVDTDAFANCTSIKTLDMPENLISIGQKAFSGCTSLTDINCGINLLGIDQDSFNGCTALININFNDKLIAIGGGSFQGCTSLKSVTNIPSSIEDWVVTDSKTKKGKGFGDGIFSGCSSLEICELPPSLTRIPQNTFYGCSKLTTVTGDFNNSGDNFTIIDSSAFEKCTSLSKVLLKNVETVDASAFAGCTKLEKVDLPSAKYIGGNVAGTPTNEKATIDTKNKTVSGNGGTFSGCTSLTHVNIPVSEFILQNSFKGCSALTSFVAGNCEVVGNNALDGCSSIEEIKLISNRYGNADPTSKNTSDGFVFQNCSAAKKITIKSGYMTKTPNGLFNGCSSLVSIDGDLTNIAIVSPKTFAGCSSLEELNLPAVRILESNAFANCSAIKKISDSSNALNAEDYGESAFLNCSELKIEIGGTISTIGANSFKNSGIQKVNIEGMQGGTVVIGDNAFANCENLTEAKILSDSAAKFSIGSGVFANCPNLKTATYDGKIITSSMFKSCPSLEKVITNSTTIKANAFEGDTALVVLEDMSSPGNSIIADEINTAAFKDCESLNTIPADAHTNIIGSNNFSNCGSLKAIAVGKLTSGIFSGCTSLSDITLVDITTIPSSAFAGCTALQDMDFTNITAIGQNAFSKSGLINIKVLNTQSIDGNAFAACDSLKSAEISANTIGQDAFNKCTALEAAIINANTIGASAFSGCSKLTNVDFISNDIYTLKEIGANAFNNCDALESLTIEGDPKMGNKCAGFVGNKLNGKFTLIGKTGSTVHTYANTNKIKFADIDGYTPPVSKVTLIGDANCDKKVSVADSVAILQSIANKDRYTLTEEGTANADCCDPGSGVTARDALSIQKLDAHVLSELPEYTN